MQLMLNLCCPLKFLLSDCNYHIQPYHSVTDWLHSGPEARVGHWSHTHTLSVALNVRDLRAELTPSQVHITLPLGHMHTQTY